MTLTGASDRPCAHLVRMGATLVRCGSTSFEYRVGGRTTTRRCSNSRACGNVSHIDVTIDHAKAKWTLDTIRAWWAKVYG